MKKTATAAPQPNPPQTREEMEDLVRQLCELELLADQLETDLETEILNVRTRYQDRITRARSHIKQSLDLAEQWALANQHEFASKKSVAMVHGTVGWRTGQPTLKTLKGWTWDRVLNVLKVAFPEYVRTKEEVAKDTIRDQRDTIGEERLQRMGLQVVQAESFYVEPHAEPEVAS